jgi:hypothetical protein
MNKKFTFTFPTDFEFDLAMQIVEKNLHCQFYDEDYEQGTVEVEELDIKNRLEILFGKENLTFTVDNQ